RVGCTRIPRTLSLRRHPRLPQQARALSEFHRPSIAAPHNRGRREKGTSGGTNRALAAAALDQEPCSISWRASPARCAREIGTTRAGQAGGVATPGVRLSAL